MGRQCALLQVPDAGSVPAGLTGRELAVLQLLRDGRTAHSIARRLGISPRTVHTHLANTYRKLGVHDRLQAVLVAQELRLPSGSSEAPQPRVGFAHAPPATDTSETVPGAYALSATVG